MRSRIEDLNSVVGDLSNPANPYLALSVAQIEQIVRAQRSLAIGDALADGFLWLIRLPGRLHAAWTSRPASTPRALGPV
jgi:hypothetical protein